MDTDVIGAIASVIVGSVTLGLLAEAIRAFIWLMVARLVFRKVLRRIGR